MIIVEFRLSIQIFPKIGQSDTNLWPKTTFTIWRTSAILNTKSFDYWLWDFNFKILPKSNDISYEILTIFKMAVVRYLGFQILKFFTFNRHYSRILHLRTQFRQNRTHIIVNSDTQTSHKLNEYRLQYNLSISWLFRSVCLITLDCTTVRQYCEAFPNF